jgi:hypothetical protein
LAQSHQLRAGARSQEAVVTHLNKTFGQHVLEEATDELPGWKLAHSQFAGVSGAVAKRHLAVG